MAKKKPVGLIQHVDPNFFFDHVPLVLQILDGEIQRLHAIGLEPQHRVEC